MLDELKSKKMLLLCGSGGVGKTSISAAIATYFAVKEGKQVCLITIDPAQRLAAALGLTTLSGQPSSLQAPLQSVFDDKVSGKLDAMMFDPHAAMQGFFQAFGDKKLEAEFAESFLFRTLFDEFSGIHEYLALETLYQLHSQKKYDMIVLDTPPARNALAFLESPERIGKFFDDRVFHLFLKDPQGRGLFEFIRARTAKTTFGLLEKLTGTGPIGEIIRLAPNIKKIKKVFLQHQQSIKNLITSKNSAAIFVLSPLNIPLYEINSFINESRTLGLELKHFILNRSLREYSQTSKSSDKNLQRLQALAALEQQNVENLRNSVDQDLKLEFLPELTEPIYDMLSIRKMVDHLQ